jgi:ATP-dependent RNA helicase DDX24/MAK5
VKNIFNLFQIKIFLYSIMENTSNDWLNYDLNEKILTNLNRLNFDSPTDIQKKVLVYTNSKVDLLIQARTGEGKTLCYGIPIVNYILKLYERSDELIKKISPVALVLVPTRELGIQVKDHITAILRDNDIETIEGDEKYYYNIKIANVLGGFAKPKQLRVLNKYNPEIIIATPGRLWEIIENEEAKVLHKLNRLRFLVLDEADRMTEKGHFRELKQILEFVYSKVGTAEVDEAEETIKMNKISKLSGKVDVEFNDSENKKIAKSLKKKGVNIAAADIETIDPAEMFGDEEMFDDMNIEEGNEDAGGDYNNVEDNADVDEDEDNNEDNEDNEENEDNEDTNILDFNKLHHIKKSENKITKATNPKQSINLRTILCSATIEQLHKKEKESQGNAKGKKFNKKNESQNEEVNNLESLIKNLKFFNKLIYLRQNTRKEDVADDPENKDSKSFILPERLELDCFKCDSTLKDYYLFHILKENEKKKVIVFTNSISHTKKIFSIFSYFDFKMVCLHSKMQQSQRIKNLDKFRKGQVNFLFCTDVGARGLDIPLVDLVIHYHIPKRTELFIHRSGRTARALKEGTSISLISEKELGLYKKIMKDIGLKEFGLKTLSVPQIEKYKSLFEFTKNVEREAYNSKKQTREKQWFQKMARDCDLLLDDDEDSETNHEQNEIEEKFLNKKRKKITGEKIKSKKIYHTINAANIKRTSFLNPDMIHKLNSLMNNSNIQGLNLTKAMHEAHSDAQVVRYKGKQKKKRHVKRRK